MEIIQILFVICLAITLLPQMLIAEENHARATSKPPFNPLEDLILIHDKQNDPKSEPLARVKRQYDPYYGRRYYPVPIILPIGGYGGYGGGFGGGFGRGFGGRGFGGRGFGGRGFGGRGFGGRGFGGGFGGRGFVGGFGVGRGRG